MLVGIGLSLLWLVSVTTRPSLPLMAREPGTQVFREAGEYPDDLPEPDIAVIRIDGGLFFATADALEDRVREVADDEPGPRAIVIDCGAIAVVDAQGAASLHEILDLARGHGLTVRLARVKPAGPGDAAARRRASTGWARTGSTAACTARSRLTARRRRPTGWSESLPIWYAFDSGRRRRFHCRRASSCSYAPPPGRFTARVAVGSLPTHRREVDRWTRA